MNTNKETPRAALAGGSKPLLPHDRLTRAEAAPALPDSCPLVSIRGSLPNSTFQRAHDPPLWVDLTNDTDPAPWALLLKSLDATRLNTAASHWLGVRDEIVRKLRDQQQSVNLVVYGQPNWHVLRDHLKEERLPQAGHHAPRCLSRSADPRFGASHDLFRRPVQKESAITRTQPSNAS